MKLFIKNNVVVWALADSAPEDNTENFEIVKVPNSTELSKVNEKGFPVPLSASEVLAQVSGMGYANKRSAEYPSIVDQLDTLYHGGYDAWKAAIQAVKDKYPKGQA